MDPHFLIKKTAEAIQSGVTPAELIENPQNILSGETKKVLLNQKERGIILYEEQVKLLEPLGFKTDDLEWVSKYNGKMRYVTLSMRDDPVVISAVENGLLKDYVVQNMPVEEWTWTVKYMRVKQAGREYIEMLL